MFHFLVWFQVEPVNEALLDNKFGTKTNTTTYHFKFLWHLPYPRIFYLEKGKIFFNNMADYHSKVIFHNLNIVTGENFINIYITSEDRDCLVFGTVYKWKQWG